MAGVSRRQLLTAGALIGTAPLAPAAAEVVGHSELPWQPDTAASPAVVRPDNNYIYFNAAEAAFVEAASARMIPKDDLGPGAIEAGVPFFIDRQLAGEFGQGTRWYMQGPWPKGLKTQGYQSRYTPAQMYRAAIPAINQATNHASNADFGRLSGAGQDGFLKKMEAGEVELSGGVEAKAFFTLLRQNVMEGFFSDPIYGGNRAMAGWKLIGFPGARYDQRAYVTAWGQRYPLPPVGIGGRPAWTGQG